MLSCAAARASPPPAPAGAKPPSLACILEVERRRAFVLNMKVNVLFFGITHELTGCAREQVEVPDRQCIADFQRACEARHPRLVSVANSVVLAVNQEIATDGTILHDGDEVAFLPPVSGGAERDLFRLTRDPIAAATLVGQLCAPADGAVVTFEGVVRDHSRGRATQYLEYEAYEPMALRRMEELVREARQKFAIDGVGIIHRLGRLEIGETSVAIVVTAEHRGAAFAACQFAIDRLKQTVPIWKKEHFADGAVWSEGENACRIT